MAGQPFTPSGADAVATQTIITTLQNLVVSVNTLNVSLKSQFGASSVYTVSGLPSVGAPARAFVSDSTVAGAGNFGAAAVGGGAHYVPVYWDNVSWKIG